MTEPTPRPTNGWAIAALVLALLGGIILAVIFAILALVQIPGRSQRGRALAIAALAISAVWVAAIISVIVVGLSLRGVSVRADELRVGDCVKDAPDDVMPAVVTRVRCDRPHRGEVFAVLPAPDTPDFPGDAAMKGVGTGCSAEFFAYAPDIPDGPTFRIALAYPSAETWAAGQRSVTCVATSEHQRWQSIRG